MQSCTGTIVKALRRLPEAFVQVLQGRLRVFRLQVGLQDHHSLREMLDLHSTRTEV
jgi:hypothetical protein